MFAGYSGVADVPTHTLDARAGGKLRRTGWWPMFTEPDEGADLPALWFMRALPFPSVTASADDIQNPGVQLPVPRGHRAAEDHGQARL